MQELTRHCLEGVTGGEAPEIVRTNDGFYYTSDVWSNGAVTLWPTPNSPGRNPATTLPPRYFR